MQKKYKPQLLGWLKKILQKQVFKIKLKIPCLGGKIILKD